jgi:hypothetical protein
MSRPRIGWLTVFISRDRHIRIGDSGRVVHLRRGKTKFPHNRISGSEYRARYCWDVMMTL